MATECRTCWGNCALETDSEMLEIDRVEGKLDPVNPSATKIRELISTLELCHHKAERWVESIIEAIGTGQTTKGLGTRSPGQIHPAERIWSNTCAALSGWCAGRPAETVELTVGSVAAPKLLAGLGKRSPLKEWQVQRVIERVRSLIGWPQSDTDPATEYAWLLFGSGEDESGYVSRCPERYREHEEFWLATVGTIVHDTNDGQDAEISLGIIIDMLWPCHWDFVENLQITLDAIGGTCRPKRPFAACGRNIKLVPIAERMRTVSRTLRAFYGGAAEDGAIDEGVLAQLGEATDARKWLAWSLDKTIRLQLNPSAEMRALTALEGPAWIKG